MTMTLKRILLFGLAVTAVMLCVSADDDDESTGFCVGYNEEVLTRPNRPKVIAVRNMGYEITSVNNIKRDPNTVYWCDLKIPDENDVMKHWKHYDFNATHWWVEKGCSGIFHVEECDTSYVRDSGAAPTSGKLPQGSKAAPKPVHNWMNIMAQKQFDTTAWSRDGATMV